MATDATFSAGVGARPGGAPAGPPSPAERCRTVARRCTALVDDGALRLPFPGEGRTRERLRALAALGREDLCVARLAGGHADAAAPPRTRRPPPEPGERGLVERVCTDVLRLVGRATGAEPLCHDARHAQAVADLTVSAALARFVSRIHPLGDGAGDAAILPPEELTHHTRPFEVVCR
ncbi:hypothetical protein OG528_05060 [Streptomyces platensis]|uniref:hypothetical protein n=1 Tax=Streptomyces platensis TaxID=58346 RepID=UPI0030E236E1